MRREQAKERSPSPMRRMVSEGEKGIVGAVWNFWGVVGLDLEGSGCCFEDGFLETPEGRVSLVGREVFFVEELSFRRLFLPIVRIRWIFVLI